jgi:hypothetical protein
VGLVPFVKIDFINIREENISETYGAAMSYLY